MLHLTNTELNSKYHFIALEMIQNYPNDVWIKTVQVNPFKEMVSISTTLRLRAQMIAKWSDDWAKLAEETTKPAFGKLLKAIQNYFVKHFESDTKYFKCPVYETYYSLKKGEEMVKFFTFEGRKLGLTSNECPYYTGYTNMSTERCEPFADYRINKAVTKISKKQYSKAFKKFVKSFTNFKYV